MRFLVSIAFIIPPCAATIKAINTQWDRGGWRGLPVGVELRYDRPAGR